MKKFTALLVVVALFAISCESSIEPQSHVEIDFPDGVEFCSYLSLENIHKTIPLINNFLSELPKEMKHNWGWAHREDIFKILVAGLNSLPCNVNARVLSGVDLTGRYQVFGVGFSVMDNSGVVRELKIDFAVIEHNGNLMKTFTQIEGFSHVKQDAIHVKTNLININEVFDFINSLDLDVKKIHSRRHTSFMPADATHLKLITNSLKARPYTLDAWVVGHLNWHPTGITFFVGLSNMHNRDYQTDWIRMKDKYKLVDWGSQTLIKFFIPEGTGEKWEVKFGQYDFVHWAERSHTKHLIR